MPTTVIRLDKSSGSAAENALGFDHSCAILQSGRAKCWGRNNFVQLGTNSIDPPQLTTPDDVYQVSTASRIASAAFHSCIVLQTGAVQCWGANDFGALGNSDPSNRSFLITVAGITTATRVSAGLTHTCALLSSGVVQCWGRGDLGQLGHGASTSFVIAVTPVVVHGINMGAAALTWISSDPSIATVDMSGRVHGVGIGTATISWEYDSRVGFVPIEVPEPGMLVGVLAGGLGLLRLVRWRQRSRTLGGPLSGRQRLILSCLLVAFVSLCRAPLAGAIVTNRLETGVFLQAQGAEFPADGLVESPPPLFSAGPLNGEILRPVESRPAAAGCAVFYGARPGHLNLLVGGDAVSPLVGGLFAQAVCSAEVETQELVTLDVPSLPQGSPIRLHALHFMIGTHVVTTEIAQFPDQAGASAALSFPGHHYQTQGPNGDVSPPLTFNVTMNLQVGQTSLLSMRLRGSGIAVASAGIAAFTVMAANSLHWGGIDWVEDLTTGQPITNWTIQSESGTDYSQPVGLPESSGGVAVGAGVVALAAACRPRRRATGQVRGRARLA